MELCAPAGRQLHLSVTARPAPADNPERPLSLLAMRAAVIAIRADTFNGGPPEKRSAVPPVTPSEVGQVPDPPAVEQLAEGRLSMLDAPRTIRLSPDGSHPGCRFSGRPDPHVCPLSRSCTGMQHPRRRRLRWVPEDPWRMARTTGGVPTEVARRPSHPAVALSNWPDECLGGPVGSEVFETLIEPRPTKAICGVHRRSMFPITTHQASPPALLNQPASAGASPGWAAHDARADAGGAVGPSCRHRHRHRRARPRARPNARPRARSARAVSRTGSACRSGLPRPNGSSSRTTRNRRDTSTSHHRLGSSPVHVTTRRRSV